MDEILIEKSFEETMTGNNTYSMNVSVKINGKNLEDILDIAEFFASLTIAGYIPLFTCNCGVFGCGGYYVFIEHTNEYWKMKNSFFPEENTAEYEEKETFEYSFTWQTIKEKGYEILEYLKEIMKEHPNCIVYPGQIGVDLTKYVEDYETILKNI